MDKLSEREKFISELKEICVEIGCSGLSPDMCKNSPHKCNIIRKLCIGTRSAGKQEGKSVV